MMRGTITAMVTPFDAQGHLDVETAQQLALWLADQGVDGLFVAGTTGESLLLSLDERRRLTEATVEAVGGRIAVLAQIGCANTVDSIALAEHAARAGADGVAVLCPFYFKVDDAGMTTHFRAVADAVPETPIYLYNIPSYCRNSISPGVVSALLEQAPNFAGIKDSSQDMILLQQYVELAPEGFAVLVGSDAALLAGIAAGGVGAVSAASNVFPSAVTDIIHAFWSGDIVAAQAAQRRLSRLIDLFEIGPPLAGYKAGLALRGLPVGGLRPPLRDMTPDEHARFAEGFRAAWPG
jgi:4-hydroxy-tetrahydrodipicolinate synthase